MPAVQDIILKQLQKTSSHLLKVADNARAPERRAKELARAILTTIQC